jgi:peptide/nickel transport system permease protein
MVPLRLILRCAQNDKGKWASWHLQRPTTDNRKLIIGERGCEMGIYLVRRVGQSLGFILVAWLLVYTVLVLWMPGGPGQTYQAIVSGNGGAGQFPFQAQGLAQRYKLDKPWPVGFFLWLFDPSDTTQFVNDDNGITLQIPKGIDFRIGDMRIRGSGLLTWDLGFTDSTGRDAPVNALLAERWLNSLVLVGSSILLALIVALPLGIVGAVRHRSRLDHTLTFVSFMGFSIPPYMLGVFLVIGLAVLPYIWHNQFKWDWLPYLPSSFVTDTDREGSLTNRLYHLVLPCVTLALPQIALLSRYVRASMLEVLQQDYIRTAWAKGLRSRRVILRHALRNALIPLITMLGVLLPGLASGAIIVETVFSYTGMGQLYFRALGGCIVETQPCPPTGYPMDYPLALTLTFIMIVIVALANLLADVLYTAVDPRISYG